MVTTRVRWAWLALAQTLVADFLLRRRKDEL